jgi:uncharacterized repeat protein (TIGR03803 family)
MLQRDSALSNNALNRRKSKRPRPGANDAPQDVAGSIFQVEPLESRLLLSTVKILDSFSNNSQGYAPYYSGVTLSGSTLYGATQAGGSGDDGTLYSEPVSGGAPTLLAALDTVTDDGADPFNLIVSGSTLYGSTEYDTGGIGGGGIIFSLPVTGGAPAVLGQVNNAAILAGMTLADNVLYGIALSSSTPSEQQGIIFSLPVTGGTPTTLASLNGVNESPPGSGLLVSGSTLYGTTWGGGTNGYGEVFSVPITGGTPTILASFNNLNGAAPLGSLIVDSSGNLYGTTSGGGAYGVGTVFSVPITGGTLNVLTSFNGPNGGNPNGDLLLSGSTLYGTTSTGGDLALNNGEGAGTVFSLPVTGGTPTTLVTFNGTNGFYPTTGLVADSSGNFYGTTYVGGAHNDGTIFELPLGEAPVVSSFAVNGGAAQRSMVTSATVVFNQPVNLATGAISLVQRATGGGSPTTITAVISSSDNVTWNLTFPAYTGGSLPDGIYDLTVTAADVTSSSTPTLTMSGGDQTFTFDRLFGDADGNGIVNNADYFQFKKTYGQASGSANYNPIFDYDANGIVNNADYFQFKARYGQQIVIAAQTSASSDAALLGNSDSSSNDKIAARILQGR